MTQRPPIANRPSLRPRAGGLATALFLAALAVSGSAAMLTAPLVEPASGQTAESRIASSIRDRQQRFKTVRSGS